LARSHPKPRRFLTLLVGAAVGLVGTLAPAHAASALAHRSSVSGHATCHAEAGEWVVTWTVTSEDVSDRVEAHQLVELVAEPAGSTLEATGLDDLLPVDEAFTIHQRVPGDATSARLAVRGKWYLRGYDRWYARVERQLRHGTVTLSGSCPPASPVSVDAVSTCTGLVITVTNPPDGEEVTALVRPNTGDEQRIPLRPGEGQTVSFPDSDDLAVTVVAGDVEQTVSWEPPECVPPEPGEVEVTSQSSCEDLTVDIVNPRDGIDTTATVTPSVGEPQDVEVPAGESVSVTVPGAEGLSVDVVIDDRTWVFAWVPGDCAVEVPIAFASDCASLSVEITNPQVAGALEATVTTAEETRQATVAPLETTRLVVSASPGTVATVTAGEERVTAEWQPPEECLVAASPSGFSLPRTGTGIVSLVLLSLAATALGITLYVGFRRRVGPHRRARHRRPA